MVEFIMLTVSVFVAWILYSICPTCKRGKIMMWCISLPFVFYGFLGAFSDITSLFVIQSYIYMTLPSVIVFYYYHYNITLKQKLLKLEQESYIRKYALTEEEFYFL
jgi:hypothetical protein